MKKETFQKMFLILLPVMAVALATTGNSVMVFDPATSITAYGSYFALIPQAGNCQILSPVAACLAVVGVVLGILYMVYGRTGYLKGILWVSLISASAAALPIAIERSIVILPNVMLPLLMCAHAGLAFTMAKDPQQKKAGSGRRLERR